MNKCIKIQHICWVAGLFDGEGCICLHKRVAKVPSRKDRSPYYRLEISIKMIHKPTIFLLRRIFGIGSIYKEYPGKYNKRISWRWTITGYSCYDFIKLVKPYLVVKYKEAKTALLYANVCKRSAFGKNLVPIHILNKREELYQKLKNIKKYEWK